MAIKILDRNPGGPEVGFQEITEQQFPDTLTAMAYSNNQTWPSAKHFVADKISRRLSTNDGTCSNCCESKFITGSDHGYRRYGRGSVKTWEEKNY